MAVQIECASDEYVRTRVKAIENGNEINPTVFPVESVVLPVGDVPVEADWDAASWEIGGPPYWALTLIDASALGDGTFQGWIRIDAGAEMVVKKGCLIIVCSCEDGS